MASEADSDARWSRVAELYAKSVNEDDPKSASGAACREILAAVDATLPFDKASYILDMGCGNGQVISRVLGSSAHTSQIPESARIVAADISQAFIDKVKNRKLERSKQNPIWNRLEVHRWDGRDLRKDISDGEVSHLLSAFVYFAMVGEQEGLSEAYRILRPGGLFVETSMGYTEWSHLTKFLKEVRPENTIPGIKEHWQTVEGVKRTLSNAGFRDVQAKEFDITLPLDKHEDAVIFVTEGFPFMRPVMAELSEEESSKVKEAMLRFVKEKHPEEPFRLTGTGLIGWGTK